MVTGRLVDVICYIWPENKTGQILGFILLASLLARYSRPILNSGQLFAGRPEMGLFAGQ